MKNPPFAKSTKDGAPTAEVRGWGSGNGRPLADDVDVAGFGVGEVGGEDEPGIDAEVESGFVLKACVRDRVIRWSGDLVIGKPTARS